MNATRRIVITGMGAVAPIGTGLDAMWQKLSAGRTGVGPIQAFSLPPDMPPFAAEVRDFEPKNFVSNRKNLRIMARDIQLAVGAAKMAMDHSAIAGKVDPTRFGVSCGAGLIATELDDLGEGIAHSLDSKGKFDLKLWGKEGMDMVQPLWMLKYLPNMPACHISILHDAQGPNNSITVGEASAVTAIGEAYRILARDHADVFLAGGCDTKIHPLSFVRLALLDKLSGWKGDPGESVRPYDADRTGLVPAEGAGFLLLEEVEHAKARKAKILGELLGFGAAWNRRDRADAAERACRAALEDAKLAVGDLGLLVGHGAGTTAEDRQELLGLSRVLQGSEVPVVGLKGYWGHAAAASGILEIVSTLLASQHGEATPTLNYQHGDRDAPKVRILTERIEFPNRPFLTLALSHSGQAAAVVVRPHAG